MKSSFFRFSQTGMFVDFIFKQIIEYFTRTVLVYTALFFGEKYIIEYLTKKTIDTVVFNTNRIFKVTDLSFNDFFIITVGGVCYILVIVVLGIWVI